MQKLIRINFIESWFVFYIKDVLQDEEQRLDTELMFTKADFRYELLFYNLKKLVIHYSKDEITKFGLQEFVFTYHAHFEFQNKNEESKHVSY